MQNKAPKQKLSRIDEFLKFYSKTMVEFKHSMILYNKCCIILKITYTKLAVVA